MGSRELLVPTQRRPLLNEGGTDMDATLLFTTAEEITQRIAALEAIDWEAYLFYQVGEHDAIAPFTDRDSSPGPDWRMSRLAWNLGDGPERLS
jgi:hypothetical protein